MKNKNQIIPVLIAATLLATVVGCTSVGTNSSQSYQPQQQTYSPPPQTPSLASTLVGTWGSGDDTLTIRPDLTATWHNDGHIEVVSGKKFQFVANDKSIVDLYLIDNNTISYGALSFASDAPDVRLRRQ